MNIRSSPKLDLASLRADSKPPAASSSERAMRRPTP
jgi:hypothetical protein